PVDIQLRFAVVESRADEVPLVVGEVDVRNNLSRRKAGQVQAEPTAAGVAVNLPVLGRFLGAMRRQDIESAFAGQLCPAFDGQRPPLVDLLARAPRGA